MTRSLQVTLALAFGLALCARASADPPADKPGPKPVRQLGNGEAVEAQPEPDAVPGREAMRRARAQLHEGLDQAREQMQVARDQMKETREQMRAAVDKAPEDARAAVEKARAEGRQAMEQARDAMKEARDSFKQALPGLAGPKDRAERARYARRMAWHTMMHRIHRPSDIPQPMRAELQHHARRMARLTRIHAIAADKKDAAVVKRSETLMSREQARHDAKMAQLEKALPGATAQPAATAHEDDEEPGEAAEQPAEEDEQENEQ
jgi:hypothetical protein